MIQRTGAFDELFELFHDIDHLFRRTMWQRKELPEQTMGMPRSVPIGPLRTAFCPPVECFTRDRQFVLRAELPGVLPRDVEVSIVGNQVFLRGEKKEEHQVDEKDLLFQEVCRGRFDRTFALPEGVDVDQVKASFHNGVLEVTMPAGAAERSRVVPIDVGEGGKKVKAA